MNDCCEFESLDNWIDVWHLDYSNTLAKGLKLYEFLGFTWEEYQLYVDGSDEDFKVYIDNKYKS
jgi:hypothetical protein